MSKINTTQIRQTAQHRIYRAIEQGFLLKDSWQSRGELQAPVIKTREAVDVPGSALWVTARERE